MSVYPCPRPACDEVLGTSGERVEHLTGDHGEAHTNLPNGYPHFAPDAELVVDAHNGPERWTGQEWNEYVDAAHRNGNMVAIRLIDCPAALPQGEPA